MKFSLEPIPNRTFFLKSSLFQENIKDYNDYSVVRLSFSGSTSSFSYLSGKR